MPKEFTGAIQSKSLLSFLKKVSERKLMAKFMPAEGQLMMTGSGKGVKFRYADKILLPLSSVETPDAEAWRELPANFGEAISIVQECTGTDATQKAMACVHVTPKWVESFQKFQATRYRIRLPIEDRFLVKPTGLRSVVAMDCTELAEGKEWVHFRNGAGIIISCRRYDEEFPDLLPSLTMDKGKFAELPDGLDGAIDRAEIFSREDADANQLMVSIEEGLLTVTAVGMTGQYWEDTSVKYDGRPLAFLISPKMLTEVVKRSSRVEITQEKLKVRGTNWTYVTSLTDPATAQQMIEETAGVAEPDDTEDDT